FYQNAAPTLSRGQGRRIGQICQTCQVSQVSQVSQISQISKIKQVLEQTRGEILWVREQGK
ncbi:MAG: hypothetical protein ACKOB4_04245, partial [Acidobacteriota bacterium]